MENVVTEDLDIITYLHTNIKNYLNTNINTNIKNNMIIIQVIFVIYFILCIYSPGMYIKSSLFKFIQINSYLYS